MSSFEFFQKVYCVLYQVFYQNSNEHQMFICFNQAMNQQMLFRLERFHRW